MQITRSRPLERNASDDGSYVPRSICIEWTPQPASRVPVRSTWHNAIGKPLTDARIAHYALVGYYGDTARLQELEKQRNREASRARRDRKHKLLARIYARYV